MAHVNDIDFYMVVVWWRMDNLQRRCKEKPLAVVVSLEEEVLKKASFFPTSSWRDSIPCSEKNPRPPADFFQNCYSNTGGPPFASKEGAFQQKSN